MNRLNVLSLFDGMSCGQIAINKIGIKDYNYFASEIDEAAIKVTKNNFPKTKHLGSVTEVRFKNGFLITNKKMIFVGKIDLLIGGSPCQNFSFSGKQKGMITEENIEILTLKDYLKMKNEGFKFKGQSFLFWEYVRLYKEISSENANAKFLLENVNMQKKWSDIISEEMNVNFIKVNSSLVTAQNRPRMYWTNIEGFQAPKNIKLKIKDILEQNTENFTFVKDTTYFNSKTKLTNESKVEVLKRNYINDNLEKETCKLVSEITGDTPSKLSRQGDRVYSILGKSPCLTTSGVIMIDGGSSDLLNWRRLTRNEKEKLQNVPENYTSCVNENKASKLLGNGWSVDIIVEFLKNVKYEIN